jgi:hypothetical protein
MDYKKVTAENFLGVHARHIPNPFDHLQDCGLLLVEIRDLLERESVAQMTWHGELIDINSTSLRMVIDACAKAEADRDGWMRKALAMDPLCQQMTVDELHLKHRFCATGLRP